MHRHDHHTPIRSPTFLPACHLPAQPGPPASLPLALQAPLTMAPLPACLSPCRPRSPWPLALVSTSLNCTSTWRRASSSSKRGRLSRAGGGGQWVRERVLGYPPGQKYKHFWHPHANKHFWHTPCYIASATRNT